MINDPFRLVVSIIRGTYAGRALQLMASGIRCVAETKEAGMKLYEEYVDAAETVLEGVDKGVCFGVVALIDTRTGEFVTASALMGKHERQPANQLPPPSELAAAYVESIRRHYASSGVNKAVTWDDVTDRLSSYLGDVEHQAKKICGGR